VTVTFYVLTAVLVVLMAGPAALKLTGAESMRKVAEHFGIPWPRYRLIGVLEAAAAVGAAAGIIWRPIGLASGFGVVALMLGALFFHIRAGDKAVACAGAVVVLLAAAGYLYAGCNRPSSSQASATAEVGSHTRTQIAGCPMKPPVRLTRSEFHGIRGSRSPATTPGTAEQAGLSTEVGFT